MIYVEAPSRVEASKKSLFLAGGITGCEDWQKKLVDNIRTLDIIVYNPRRANFDVSDPNASDIQITWEHDMLRKADVISFWFSSETIQPIVLYELGAHSMTRKPILVGMDPGYKRKQDVEIQTRLVRPEIKIVSTLDELSDQVYQMFNQINFIA